MTSILLYRCRTSLGLLQKELAANLGWDPPVISALETGRLHFTGYHVDRLTEFFFGKPKPKLASPGRVYWDQPRSPIYNLSYPREMMLLPAPDKACILNMEEECAKLQAAQSHLPDIDQTDIVTHAQYAAIKKSIPKNTLFRYSETMPSVGDIILP